MPYIRKERREEIGYSYLGDAPDTAGEMNYSITTQIRDWIDDPDTGVVNYEKYNAAIGVLECVKMELYRRVVAPYEDKKCAENGDVFDVE